MAALTYRRRSDSRLGLEIEIAMDTVPDWNLFDLYMQHVDYGHHVYIVFRYPATFQRH